MWPSLSGPLLLSVIEGGGLVEVLANAFNNPAMMLKCRHANFECNILTESYNRS
jgi:hypothetical protein